MAMPIPIPTIEDLHDPDKYRQIFSHQITLGPAVLVVYYKPPTPLAPIIRIGNIVENNDVFIKFKNANGPDTAPALRYTLNQLSNAEMDPTQHYYIRLYEKLRPDKVYYGAKRTKKRRTTRRRVRKSRKNRTFFKK